MLGKGVNVISFTLNNFEDDLRFTTSDIKYVASSISKIIEGTNTLLLIQVIFLFMIKMEQLLVGVENKVFL